MSDITNLKVAHFELSSESCKFKDGDGRIDTVAKATVGVHHTLIGKIFKLVFPPLLTRPQAQRSRRRSRRSRGRRHRT